MECGSADSFLRSAVIQLEMLWEFNRMSMLNLVAWTAQVNASTIFGDYHRMLAPGKSYEVIASMPGFQSKTTHILLEDGAMNLDFVLDPEEEPTQRVFLGNTFDCSCDGEHKFALMDFLRGFHLQISLISFAILSFILFLVKKRRILKVLKHRTRA
ncbi:hypothetical protein Taro_048332 [Colocasia esculenta]|uniref:Uncharacterized protein n=1 Tax=Colocasia esculenta TaxID=4460 RepID=A0A843X7D4_COLES|nr:hypothetical protein [Colocasia esculenta]